MRRLWPCLLIILTLACNGGGGGGGTTNPPPAPTISAINPQGATAGGSAFTLSLTGSHFFQDSIVQWNGLARTTTYVSSNQLQAAITAQDLANPGTAQVSVSNPTAEGGASSALAFAITAPPPTLVSLNPSTTPAGGSAFILSVNGSHFFPDSVVQWGGLARTTTFVSSTLLQAAITAQDLTNPGSVQVSVSNPAAEGGASNILVFSITAPPPSLTSLSPSTILAGGPDFTLTVNGSQFFQDSIVQWNGSARTTTFVSSTQLQAAISAQDIATTSAAQVSVRNPAAEGGGSSTLAFTVTVPPPAPTLASLSPSTRMAGGPAFTITVNGSHFFQDSSVLWNGSPRTTTFVSITQLQAAITAQDIAIAGATLVSVSNPTAEGGASGALAFSILTPTLTTLSPQSAVAGGPAITLTVNGSHFFQDSSVLWNGSSRPTTFVSDTQLQAAITAQDIVATGSAQVIVSNPSAEGGPTNALGFSITAPVPTVTALSPLSAVAGGPAFTLTVNGSHYFQDTLVLWKGSPRATTFISDTQLQAAILASDITIAGTAQIAVKNPIAEGGTSSALNFSIVTPPPVPTITSLSPLTATSGGPAFTLTVNGSHFFQDSTVLWKGLPRATLFLSSTQLQAAVTAADIASVGSAQVSVSNPAAEGGTSSTSSFSILAPQPPTITSLLPTSVVVGGSAFTLTLNGTHFFPDSIVNWNGVARTTTYLSGTQLQAAISAPDLASPGTAQVTVSNPALEGGSSGSFSFQINLPAQPTIAFTNPMALVVGGPDFTLRVSGTHFFQDSTVLWNGLPRATTYVSSLLLQATISAADIAAPGMAAVSVSNPAAEGGDSAPTTLAISNLQTLLVNYPTNDILWDSTHGVIYASLPSTAGAKGNSIAIIDPSNGNMTAAVYAGSEPNHLAISDDGQYLYVGVDGESRVQRFTLPAMSKSLSIPLGGGMFGSYSALDIQVAPAAPHTIAVSLGNAVSPSAQGGVVIFDDAVARPTIALGGASLFDSLQWGVDATTLFGANSETSSYDLYLLAVNGSGVQETLDLSHALNSFGNSIHFENSTQLVYADSGQAFTTAAHFVGGFHASGPMVPDGAQGLAFFLDNAASTSALNFTLKSFHLNQFTSLGSATTRPFTPSQPLPSRLIKWGSDGLALGGRSNPLYILSGPFAAGQASTTGSATLTISSISPLSAVTGGPAFTLQVTGTDFMPGSTVQWNGVSAPTTFLSSTQLQASIPAQDISTAGTAQVTVNNPNPAAVSGVATFTIANLNTSVVSVPANDIVWDSARAVIYASIPSTAGADGNSIAIIDPVTGGMLRSVFAGSDPNRLAISGDGQFLYAGIDGAAMIQRYTLPDLTPDMAIPLGTDPGNGPYYAMDIQVAPANPHTIAVTRGDLAYPPSALGGLVIYDDATPRATTISSVSHELNSVQWGSDASTIYGANCGDTFHDYYTLSADASGVHLTLDVRSTFNAFNNWIHFDPITNLIYSDSGPVLTPATGQRAGNFSASGAMTPDPSQTLAYFLEADTSGGTFTLKSFHLTHFVVQDAVTLQPLIPPTTVGAPTRLLRWSSNGLAFSGGGHLLYLVTGPFVAGL